MDDLDVGAYLGVLAEHVEGILTPEDGYAQSVANTVSAILFRLAGRAEATRRSEAVGAAGYADVLSRAGVSVDPTRPVRDQAIDAVDAVIRRPAGHSDAMLRAMLCVERDRTQALLASGGVQGTSVQAADNGFDDDFRRRLGARLQRRFGPDVRVQDVVEIAGGFSKRTLFASLAGGDAPDQVVVRMERSFNVLGTRLSDEFPMVAHVHAAGVPVPEPLLLETDESVLGHVFAVYSRMSGEQIGDIDGTDRGSVALGTSLAGVLARLHATSPDGLALSVTTPLERMTRELDAFESRWRDDGEPTLTLRIAYDWLRRNLHLADGAASIIHRDVGWHNMLVADDEVVALLDWEMATIGVPVQDLGYVYLTASALMEWDDFLAAYERAGGTLPDDRRQIDYFRVWREVWRCSNVRHAKRQIETGGVQNIRLSAGVVIKLDGLELRLQNLLLDIMNVDEIHV